MRRLEDELAAARELSVTDLADAVQSIGFECTRCGACCKGEPTAGERDGDREERSGGGTDDAAGGSGDSTGSSAAAAPHTATVFPDEVRRLQAADDYDWRDVARPMPFGLSGGEETPEGETFEWALQTDTCGDCTFYEEDEDGVGACTVHDDRPLICATYPFSVALGGTSQPMGEAVDEAGVVRAHECEGLGRSIDREDAETLARTLKERAVREIEEAIAVREAYEPAGPGDGEVVVHDSEGAKRSDGSRYDG